MMPNRAVEAAHGGWARIVWLGDPPYDMLGR